MLSSLESLPVEILHRILDDLDVQTILFSFRNTCQLLRAVANSYNRYSLNFQSISKFNFELICRSINPHLVKSLTLLQNNQSLNLIKVFLSHFHLQQFSHLWSLSLCIAEEEFYTLVQSFNIPSLQSFSLKIEKSDDRRKSTTARLLSSILAQSNLFKLELHIQYGRLEKMIWPNQYSIQHLKIDNIVSFDQVCSICRCCPHLRTLIINSISVRDRQQIVLSSSLLTLFQSLTSLTLNDVNIEIDDLEWFLSLTSSLIHLRLIGCGNYLDGNRWEHFIQLHLRLLSKFEFVFKEQQYAVDVKTIIASFETPFWLEDKQWFVTCETTINSPNCITLYSIPICVSFLSYNITRASVSTLLNRDTNEMFIMDNVNEILVDFTKLMPLPVEKKETTRKYPLFRKIKTLQLDFGTDHLHGWFEFVSKLIDLTPIVQIKVSSISLRKCNPEILADMASLFRRTCRLSSIDICFDFFSRKSNLTAAEICSMVPLHVKHLAVSVKNVNEIKNILEHFHTLSSANFYFDYTPTHDDIVEWFNTKRKGSCYETDSFSVCIWLGKKNVLESNNKKIKLTNEYHQ